VTDPNAEGHIPFHHARLSVFRFVQSVKLQQRSFNLKDTVVHAFRYIMLPPYNTTQQSISTKEPLNEPNNRIAPNIITDSAIFLGGNGGGFVPEGTGAGVSFTSLISVSELPAPPMPDGPASGFFEMMT
jgi:hypothetical protein